MTILDALKSALKDFPDGMTNKEAYQEIIKRELYVFPAKKPEYVVNGIIRRHCLGLDFPTAYPIKYFKIVGYKGKKPLYALLDLTNNSLDIQIKKDLDNEILPEEQIQKFYLKHLDSIYTVLIDSIMANSPTFFERLIVDLLLKMGYGYDDNSGIVVGGFHDHGIDGIIREDKLGLSLIYLQAKRYGMRNKVGSPELQTFIGAMKKIQKGVFITTSQFTKAAIKYVEDEPYKNLKLIDGKMLTQLMVKYEVGVTSDQSIKLYKIDTAYFET